MIDGLVSDAHALTTGAVTGIAEGFGADAWLANWDVAGLGYDNLLVKDGRAWRVDTGGALLFRAQGGLKGAAFGDTVAELNTLRDAKINAQAAAVFGHLSEGQIKASVARVLSTNDDAIRQTVMQFGGGPLAERSALADKLIARKAFLAQVYPDVMPKIAEARQLAVETATTQVLSVTAQLDDDILAAIKGIASRAKAGAALTTTDIARVSTAASRYQALLASDALFDASLDQLKAHYGPWLSRLQAAIEGGAGKAAVWDVGKLFSGIKSTHIGINPAKVKPVFAPYLFGDGAMFSAAEVRQVLRDVEEYFGEIDYLAKAKVPHNNPDAAAFDKMPAEYKRALWSWTPSHIYRQVNRELVREAEEGVAASAAVKEYQKLLNDAIKNAPTIRQFKGLSSRGMINDPAKAKAFYERMLALKDSKGIYQMEGFGSSTVGDKPGFSGYDVWLHIESKTGVHINSISQHPGVENEVLFGTAQRFKVTNAYEEGGKYHIELEEL